MQTPDKKKQMFLDMQEHPEKYSEEQIEALMDELDQVPDVDAAWQRHNSARNHAPVPMILKIAAMFVGVLMLSGIAYAAIHIVSHVGGNHVGGDLQSPTQETRISNSSQQTADTDTIAVAQPKLYDNVPLEQMLTELSTYYNIKVEYRTEAVRKIRLFYQWKPDYSIEKVVEMLNNFDWLQLELKSDTLFVSSSIEPQP